MSSFSLQSSQFSEAPNPLVGEPPSAVKLHRVTPTKTICKVCGVSEALGIRYGALCCRGCESFFCRNKSKPSIGECKNDEECQKFPTCLRCIPCRLQKCLKAGMYYIDRYSPSLENTENNISPSTSSAGVETCAVCGGKASGCHYGVLACETCRQFFSRTKRKQPVGYCGGNCSYGCVPCRYQKCRRAGMGKEEEAKFRKVLPGLAIVLDLLEAHQKICEYTEFRMKRNEIKEYPWTPDKNLDQTTNRLYAWKAYSWQMIRDIKSTVIFIRRHLQNNLSNEDTVQLIKIHAFRMHMVRITRAVSKSGLLLPDRRLIDSEFFKALYGEQLAEQMIAFADEALNVFKLDDDGLAMMLTMSFFSEIAENDLILYKIGNPKAVENLRQGYRRIFIQWCDNRKAPRTFRNVHLMLQRLKQLDELHKTDVISFLKANARHFDQRTVFAEVYLKR